MAAEIVIDEAARAVFLVGERIPLTKLEFDLLAALASTPGKVHSRDELLETVWRSKRDWQSPATVNEHVRRLRAKLDRKPATPSVITTVRGVGYALEPAADVVLSHDSAEVGSYCFAILDGTRVVDASPALLRLLGADSRDAVVGHETFEFVAALSLPTAKRLADQRAAGELPRPKRLTLRRIDGSETTVEVAASVVVRNRRQYHQVTVWSIPDDGADHRDALEQADDVLLPLRPRRSSIGQARPDGPSSSHDPKLSAAIARGVDAGEFEPHYEPIVHLETHRVLAVEALARWRSPTLGLLPPAAFLGAAEGSGDIIKLGRHLLRAASKQIVHWQQAGHILDLAFNLSARQLLDDSLPADIAAILAAAGLPGDRLIIEITETDLIDDIDLAAHALHRLADHGVRISIDDFGTGWASLTYLQRFPVHILKIDRSFTAGVLTNPNDTAIARAIISLGNELDLLVIAEGIETADQKAAMYDLGCWLGQGYHFAKPQPAPNVTLTRDATA